MSTVWLHLYPFFDLFKTYLRSHKLVHSRWNKNRSKSLHPGQLLLFSSKSVLLLLSPHLLLHLGRLGEHLVDVHDLVQVLVAGKNAFLIQWHTMDFILLSLTQAFNSGLWVKKRFQYNSDGMFSDQGVRAITTQERGTHLRRRFRDRFRTCCVLRPRYPAMEGVSAVKGTFETNASASRTTSGVPAPKRNANWVADFSNEIFRVDSLTLMHMVFIQRSLLFRIV